MKFNSKTGQELRTWILFFVGISLAVLFALQKNPLSPWWTLVIGAFTCTAVIVSAVQSVAGGMTDATRRTLDEARRKPEDPDEKTRSSNSFTVGTPNASLICNF
jgi:hypothetical protein